MTTRAAINILGSDGSIIDVTSLGFTDLTTSHPGTGRYQITGTHGMVPPPEGWGYVVNQADADKTIDITFSDGELLVSVGKDGKPVDLAHSITLHVSVEDLPPVEIPELPVEAPSIADPQAEALTEYSRLRAIADFMVAPLQDAVDVDEATDTEVVLLKAWKKYRVALNRVSEQPGYPTQIDWPAPPA